MTREIEFGGEKIKPDVRHLYDMEEVIYDEEWLKDAENVPLYYMYRGLSMPEDEEAIRENGLRYDITVMPARRLGKEPVKTKGHYHPKVNSMTYPEIYGVLEGEAHYLLQKKENGRITQTVLVEAKEGDKVIIPPNYGHVTINPSGENLKMANWVCRDFDSIYEPIQRKGGTAWFELVKFVEDTGTVKKWAARDPKTVQKAVFRQNKNYKNVPKLEFFKASKHDPFQGEIYDLIESPERLEFLTDPEDNKNLFESLPWF